MTANAFTQTTSPVKKSLHEAMIQPEIISSLDKEILEPKRKEITHADDQGHAFITAAQKHVRSHSSIIHH